MKSIHQWLSEYGESHQNKTNKTKQCWFGPQATTQILTAWLPNHHQPSCGLAPTPAQT
jgi:hypothetical protein